MFSRATGRYGDETARVRRRPFWKEAFPSTFPLGRHSSIAAPVSTRSSSSASQCRAGPATRKRRSSRGRGNRLLPKVNDSVSREPVYDRASAVNDPADRRKRGAGSCGAGGDGVTTDAMKERGLRPGPVISASRCAAGESVLFGHLNFELAADLHAYHPQRLVAEHAERVPRERRNDDD